MSTDRTNALAGPSTVPNLFLQPASPHAQSHTQLASTQDLISRFRLLSAYDTHVRPYIDLLAGADDAPAPPTPLLSTPASRPFTDKGKGKEREQSDPFPGVGHAPTPGGSGPDGGDEDGKGEKKKKNNYRHLIKGVPGKHSMKKDDYLVTTILAPPKQRMPVRPFDRRTQDEAFTVSFGGLPGWNPSVLIEESAQAKEERKKRKEAKKLAKANGGLPTPGLSPATPTFSAAVSVAASGSAPPAPATPAATTPYRPILNGGSSRAGTPRVGTPVAAAPAAAASTRPAAPPITHALPARPQLAMDVSRGKKRERDLEPLSPMLQTPVNGHGSSGLPLVNHTTALAGVPGARPRPLKKQKNSHGLPTPVQQPTPQGVL